MKDLFVPYELAVKLKEKGFRFAGNGSVLGFAWDFDVTYKENIGMPLWQQVIDWLREEKGIAVHVGCIDNPKFFFPNVKIIGKVEELETKSYDTYYLALQSGIEKALELI